MHGEPVKPYLDEVRQTDTSCSVAQHQLEALWVQEAARLCLMHVEAKQHVQLHATRICACYRCGTYMLLAEDAPFRLERASMLLIAMTPNTFNIRANLQEYWGMPEAMVESHLHSIPCCRHPMGCWKICMRPALADGLYGFASPCHTSYKHAWCQPTAWLDKYKCLVTLTCSL